MTKVEIPGVGKRLITTLKTTNDFNNNKLLNVKPGMLNNSTNNSVQEITVFKAPIRCTSHGTTKQLFLSTLLSRKSALHFSAKRKRAESDT
jgi:hypothetical protein